MGIETEGLTVNEARAMVGHEVNRIYCMLLGDFSQPHWEDAPDWQKDSARAGVAVEYATPEDAHEGWMALKIAEGWRYGPEKDPGKKTHPCILPYDKLPLSLRLKDHLFRDVTSAFTAIAAQTPPLED